MSGAASRRNTLRRRWPLLLGGIILVALAVADHRGLLLVSNTSDLDYLGRSCRVVRVIDGDTLDIDMPDPLRKRPITRIRLWGIDCPEAAGTKRPSQPWAGEATSRARSLVAGRTVTVLVETHRTRDVFGRLLAHIELADGTNLGEILLQDGLAVADDRWPHSRLGRYDQLETAARRRAIGIWSQAELRAETAR